MEIFAVLGVPPEVQAYALAKYSRSAQSMAESVHELSAQRAEQFLATFYFQYGHRSIADLAHLTLGVEGISLLAEFQVADEPLWDGQSRSSRYQDFRRNGCYQPPLVESARERYDAALAHLLTTYESFSGQLLEILKAVTPRPEAMPPAAYTRALRARAFDVARAFLPLATRTSLGQITSARVLEGQISRLAASPLPELRAVAAGMRDACRNPAQHFLDRKLRDAWAAADLSAEQIAPQRELLAQFGLIESPAGATLVKYTAASPFPAAALAAARAILAPRLAALTDEPERVTGADLAPPESDPLEALTATLCYLLDERGHSLRQLRSVVAAVPEEERRALLRATLAERGDHDDWLRLHRLGYGYVFDLCLDFGALRDLHRHRRCVQIIPDLTLDLGYEDPLAIFAAGLGAAGADLAGRRGLADAYRAAMDRALAAAQTFPVAEYAPYLLPLGARQRALFKMDLAEAAYLIELRTQVGGHFAYRRLAYAMYERLIARHPYLSEHIHATPPSVSDPLAR